MADTADTELDYVHRLVELSLRGLGTMFDAQAQLFCYRRMRVAGEGLVNEGVSLRYTLITLLGLHRLQSTGRSIPFDIRKIILPVMTGVLKPDNLGDVGLFLWFVAQAMPQRLKDLLPSLALDTICERYADGRQHKTMELSWLLTGLSYAAESSPEIKHMVEFPSRAAYELIKKNYGGKGIFAHSGSRSIVQRIRRRMGSFADQVYPAYAFAAYCRAFGAPDAGDIALTCCKKLCDLQGPLGQWWWHYDAVSGRVAGRYPVFSVHQEGMAPMALFAVGKLTENDFAGNIYRGLHWNDRGNELQFDMVDWKENIIRRSIFRPRLAERIEEFLALAGREPRRKRYRDLRILFEGRPYCLGWLLYAFSTTGR
jgi:hypothetical protein